MARTRYVKALLERRAVRFGAEHRVPAEIEHNGYSPEDDWTYNGAIWVRETRPVTTSEFDQDLTDPLHEPIVTMLRSGWSDDRITLTLIDPSYAGGETEPAVLFRGRDRYRSTLRLVRRVRWAQEHAGEAHVLRTYGLMDATKSDERILVTLDQDLITEAPMTAYFDTRKGRRARIWMLLIATMVPYMAFIFLFPTLADPTAASQAGSQIEQAAVLVAIPEVAIVVWFLTARRTNVLDMQLSPLVDTGFGAHTELAMLLNSTKTSPSRYLSRILRIPTDSVERLATTIRNLNTDIIAQKDEELEELRYQVNHVKVGSLDATNGSLDLGLLGHRGPPSVFTGLSTGTIVALVIIVGAVAAGLTYAVIASGL